MGAVRFLPRKRRRSLTAGAVPYAIALPFRGGCSLGALGTEQFPNTAVTPADAGVQYALRFGSGRWLTEYWFPASAGMTA
jgi:hypothetical protein